MVKGFIGDFSSDRVIKREMIKLLSEIAIFVAGAALVVSVITNVRTSYLLKQGNKILDFCIGLPESDEVVKGEGTE